MNINLNADSTVDKGSEAWADLQAAAKLLQDEFNVGENITINIDISFKTTNDDGSAFHGGFASANHAGTLSYAAIVQDLKNHATLQFDKDAYNSLAANPPAPTTDTLENILLQGQTTPITITQTVAHDNIVLSRAQAKVLGLLNIDPTGTIDKNSDGSATFNPNDVSVGLALHELTHVMGRDAGAGNIGFDFTGSASNPQISDDIGILDLFRFSASAPNTSTYDFSHTSGPYLSYDFGKTNLGSYDTSDAGDFAHITGINDGADAFFENVSSTFNGNPVVGVPNDISNFDIDMMGVIGYKHADIHAHDPGTPGSKTGSPTGLSYHVKIDMTQIDQITSGDIGIADDTDFTARVTWLPGQPIPPAKLDDRTDPITPHRSGGLLGLDNVLPIDPENNDEHNWAPFEFDTGGTGVDPTNIPVDIQLWDDDGFLNFKDNQVDINKTPGDDPNTQLGLLLSVNATTGTFTIQGYTDSSGKLTVFSPTNGNPAGTSTSGDDNDAEGGNATLTFTVTTSQNKGQTTVTHGNSLDIEGDQTPGNSDDSIVIDKTAADGLKVTVNGTETDFAAGQITDVNVLAGSGTNIVTLLAPVSFTYEGGGTDKLILGPNLTQTSYSPDASGQPDWGTVNIGTAQVQLKSVEAVQNLAPAITSVQLTASSMNENGFVGLIGQFIDAGSLSTETVTVDWGDGTTDTVLQNAAGQRGFVDTHQYLDDNPTGTPSDSYNIKVTVTDNDNLSASSTTSVTVNNVPPVITSVSSGATASNLAKEGQPVSFQGAFTDVGTQDTHTATLDYADGTGPHSAQVTEAGGNGTFSDSHVFASGGIYPIAVAVTDDDTGQATTSTQAFVTGFGIHTFNGVTVLQGVGTNQSDTMVVKQHKDTLDVTASFLDGTRSFSTVGLDRIELYGLDGNDTLDVRNTTLPVILDGGNGDDTLRAGDGKDTLIGGAGDDRLFGGKGDDTFIGGPGNDFMQGGTGTNTADYSAETSSITINLTTHQATGASIGTDNLISFDNVIGGSADDTFIDGRGEGGAGYSFDGGGGSNTAVFHGARSAYSVVTSLGTDGLLHTTVVDHGGAGDAPVNLVNVQRLQFADQTVASFNVMATHGQSFAASSLFTAIAGGGHKIEQYDFWDSGVGGGHFVLNAQVLGANQDNYVTAGQLTQTNYQSGSGTDTLWARAYDGAQWSPWSQSFTVTAPIDTGPTAAPISTNVAATHGQSFAASNLFTASDPFNDAITQYDFWNSGVGGGQFAVNGQALGANQNNYVSATQLAATTYQSGSGTDTLWVRVSDGSDWSPWSQSFRVTAPIDTGPVVTSVSTINTTAGQSFVASTLFAASDPFGDAIEQYDFWDTGAGGGHFTLNGQALGTGQNNYISAAQLAQTSYIAGSGTDTLWVCVNEGGQWSPWSPSFTVSNRTTIGTGETLEVTSASSGQLSFASDAGTLRLDNSASFAGTVAGMSGKDTIDFTDIDPAKVQMPSFNGDPSGGKLTVTDGTHRADIALIGNYMASVFVASSDGHGGTSVVDPPAQGGVQPLVTPSHA
jgi:hypothetical protein